MNTIIIITAPSGAGKTSIVHHLLHKMHEQLAFSISATTRTARVTEVHGQDYYFMTEPEFHTKIANHEFVEWEMVYQGTYYGTLHSELQRIWNLGKVPVLDIDVKGAIHVQEQYGAQCLSIFVQAPSIQALTARLQQRGTETAATLQTRIDKASYELSFKNNFDAIIINDVLSVACAEAENLIIHFLEKNTTFNHGN